VGKPDSTVGGYALLAVLWLLLGISGLTLLISASAGHAIAPSRNRIALKTAHWSALGCLAHARMVLTRELEDEVAHRGEVVSRAWNGADRVLAAFPPPADLGCEITARAVGSRLDINSADESTLSRVLSQLGVSAARADSMASIIVRHRPYTAMQQVAALKELNTQVALDSVLDVHSAPISLNNAPGAILALLPGFTQVTVRRVLAAREAGKPVSSFHELSQLLSPDDPGASARLPGLVVLQPHAWVITVRARAGRPLVTIAIEQWISRAGTGTAVGTWRSWIE
jgi:hypothetical protein